MRSLDKDLKDPRWEFVPSTGFPTDNELIEARTRQQDALNKLSQLVKQENFEEAYNFFISQNWKSFSLLTDDGGRNSNLKKYNEAHTQLHKFLLNFPSEDKLGKLETFYKD
ncbi:hypothetical protein H1Q59_08140 [Holosporaceae bacterium 'Namur']|nr:hypothetical protein [Holosporaceae bacterium 'Namur']